MEAVESRPDSPFLKSKAKSQFSDASESGNLIIEQVKVKKKNMRNKSKSQSNDKENEDVTNSGKDLFEEKSSSNDVINNGDPNNAKDEIRVNNGHDAEITNETREAPKMEDKENDALNSACEVANEKIANEPSNQVNETGTSEEFKNTECVKTVDMAEVCTEQFSDNIIESQSYSKEDNLRPSDLPPKFETECEKIEEKCNGETNDILKENNDFSLQEEEMITKEYSKTKDTSEISVNGSESSSHYEEANTVEDYIQASPDTATKDEESFTNKITHFLGKWSYLHEQNEDSEVSSSKKSETTLNHPYLSKVSGRRGIKERLNLSTTGFSLSEMEVKTPESMGLSLNDSFRVRTNPPRLSSLNFIENPTLRKFKGKRCLNTGEPDDEDDMHANSLKKRKLEDKTLESGILGSILWSPFKKKSVDNEDPLKLATTESKLSRLLSPFWFWKKTAAGQKEK